MTEAEKLDADELADNVKEVEKVILEFVQRTYGGQSRITTETVMFALAMGCRHFIHKHMEAAGIGLLDAEKCKKQHELCVEIVTTPLVRSDVQNPVVMH